MMKAMVRYAWLLPVLAGCIVVEEKDNKDNDTVTNDADADTDSDADSDADSDTDTDTEPPDPDIDQDGFTVGDGDCDDNNANIFPGALEICDTIENNCIGGIDDEAAVTLDGVNYATLDEALVVAVTSATPGTLEVCPGTWPMTRVNLSTALSMHAVAGRDLTTLNEVADDVLVAVGDGGSLTLEGFTVTGSLGAALSAEFASTLTITDSRISANGQGINVAGLGAVISITGTDIDDNINGNGDGGGIAASGEFDLTLTSSNVRGNSAPNGGGLFAEVFFGSSTITLTDTLFDLNTADVGAGMVLKNVTVIGDTLSTVSGGVATSSGGGLALFKSEVSGVLITGNQALNGGGVAAMRDPDFDLAPLQNLLSAVVIDVNTADNGAGLYIQQREPATVDALSAVTLNTAAIAGGGAFLDGDLSEFRSDGADFGTAGSDNAPEDVSTTAGPFTAEPGDLFSCTGGTGCTLD